MTHIPQALHDIFPDSTEVLQTLKTENAHFITLAERFETFDTEVRQIEAGEDPASEERLEELKKHRLLIMDEIAVLVAAETPA